MKAPLLSLLILLPALASGEDRPLLSGELSAVSFGMSFQQVFELLGAACGSVRAVEVEPPSFPLAEARETHLVCAGYPIMDGVIDTLSFTFADDGLVLGHAAGGTAVLRAFINGPVQAFMHLSASFTELIVFDEGADELWFLSPESAHPNLFQWSNPYGSRSTVSYDASAARPAPLRFGETLDALEHLLDERCTFRSLQDTTPWLLTEPAMQQQVDCFGVEFAGFPRKIEAIFGDGVLEQAWILTGKGEEDRVRQALIKAWGEPIHVNETWEVFADNQVMLRKDKPEVLMLSEQLAPLYRRQVVDR